MNRRAFLGAVPLLPSLFGNTSGDEGFMSLFDGKSLKGWVVEEGPESAFFVQDGALFVHESASPPAWLRSEREYENFDYRGEFFIEGWMDSGIYLQAPLHGRQAWTGFEIKIFHSRDETPAPESMGAVFPLIAPRTVNVKSGGAWNDFRILMDWPRLAVWTNGEQVQELNVESVPELRYRLRHGYLGFATASTPMRFRNLRIRELPSKESWETLYESAADFGKWLVTEGQPNFQPLGGVLRTDGLGHLATKQKYRDFELQLYIRGCRAHNGGILFRSAGEGLKNPRHYEIQLHNVEEAHYPTGSLYHHKRAIYPRIEDEKWFLMQLRVEGKRCLVRINGENVLEYDRLDNLDEGHIELQAHRAGYWIEYKRIRVKRL
jgi:hypothetical protein